MSFLDTTILGILQGLTEFLPISSSGHLVIMQYFLGVKEPGVIFEVLLHFGTLLAIFAVYWRDIIAIIASIISGIYQIFKGNGVKQTFWNNPYRKMAVVIVIGTIPTGIIGATLEPFFERIFESVQTVAITLIITGALLWIVERLPKGRKDIKRMTILDSLIIGFAQGIAITPGISRSGSTIATGLLLGMDRELATKYSFLLSIPAVFGAAVLKLSDLMSASFSIKEAFPMLWGVLIAAISGYWAILFLIKLLKKGRLDYFAYYCWTLALIVNLYLWLH